MTPENMEDSALDKELHVREMDVFTMSYHRVSLADCGAHTIRYSTVLRWYSTIDEKPITMNSTALYEYYQMTAPRFTRATY